MSLVQRQFFFQAKFAVRDLYLSNMPPGARQGLQGVAIVSDGDESAMGCGDVAIIWGDYFCQNINLIQGIML